MKVLISPFVLFENKNCRLNDFRKQKTVEPPHRKKASRYTRKFARPALGEIIQILFDIPNRKQEVLRFRTFNGHALHDFSNPKLDIPRCGSGRGARRGGGAGPGRMGRRQNSSPKRQASLVPPKASKTRLLNVFPEARTNKSYVNRMREQQISG